MPTNALLFAPPADADEAPWPWIVDAGDGLPQEGSGLAALRAALGEGGASLLLVVPGEDVLATRVTVPARSRAQLAAALPFVVEEHLAVDVERVHLAAGPRDGDGRIPVRVVDPERLAHWLAILADADLRPDAARMDADALPQPPADHLAVHVDAERARVRSRDAAFTVPRPDLAPLLQLLIAAEPDAEWHVHLVTVDADAMDLAGLEVTLQQHGRVTVERSAPGDAASDWVQAFTGRPGPELLTGPYAPPRRSGVRGGARWRLVAGLAVVWFGVELGLDVARAGWLEARTESLREDVLAVFREVLPSRTRSPDPRRELEALLGQGPTGSAPFLDLLGVVAGELQGIGGPVTLRTVNFNAARGDLAVDLNVSGIAAVDRFKAGVEASGYAVTIDSAVQEASGVRARVRIATGGAS